MKDPILLDFPDRIELDRVVLRPPRPGDGPALFEAIDASRDHLAASMPWAEKATSPEATEATARHAWVKWLLRTDLQVLIHRRSDGLILGGSGLHRIDWDRRRFEIGYWIRPEAEGHGYVKETVIGLRDFAFSVLDAQRVTIETAAANVRSAAVATRTGFLAEGRLVSNIRYAGEIQDTLVFGMNRSRWKEVRG